MKLYDLNNYFLFIQSQGLPGKIKVAQIQGTCSTCPSALASFPSDEKQAVQTGAAFKWTFVDYEVCFSSYSLYRDSVTHGGIASGPENAKFFRNNKSKSTNENDEYLWVSFKCGPCPNGCSKEVIY